MSKTSNPTTPRLVCKALGAAFAGAALLGVNTFAAETNQTTELPAVVVTGSLIPTAETVGPAPIQNLSSENIQQAGTADALITLKKLVPGFTGAGNYLGAANNN